MASKDSGLYGIKNKEASERRRPSLHYVDLSGLLVFTKEDLDKEMMKIPEQRLRLDDETILNRTISVKRLPSLTPSNDPLFLSRDNNSDYGGSLDRKRRRSSALSAVSSSCSRPSSPGIGMKSFGSFYELSQVLSKVDDDDHAEPFPYPDPVPPQLRHLDMKDLIATDIDWKMLTMARPPTKVDEDFFSRFVECARLQEKAKVAEGYGFRQAISRMSRHSRLYNRYAHIDLSSELQQLNLQPDFDYDSYARTDPDPSEMNKEVTENANEMVAKLLGDDTFGGDSSETRDESDYSEATRERRKSSQILTNVRPYPGMKRTSPSTAESEPTKSRLQNRKGRQEVAMATDRNSKTEGPKDWSGAEKSGSARRKEREVSPRPTKKDGSKAGQVKGSRRRNAEAEHEATTASITKRRAGRTGTGPQESNKFASGLLETTKPFAPMIVVTTAVLPEAAE